MGDVDQFKKITNLSLKQKIIGFIICVSLAAFFAILVSIVCLTFVPSLLKCHKAIIIV